MKNPTKQEQFQYVVVWHDLFYKSYYTMNYRLSSSAK